MTNKKLKFAAMSVALTACVAAQPLAAHAVEDLGPVADDPAPEQNEPSEASSSSEETVEEIKNETLNPDPEPSEDMDVKEAFGDDVDIKYDPDKATKDEETGTVTTPGDVIRKEDPDQPGETDKTDKTGETDPSGSTDETGKTDGSEEAGEVIGSAERNETDESSSNTVTPDPGAPSTPSGPSVSGTDEDGNTTITTPTLTPGTDTTITEGTGSATADNEKKPDVTETAPDDINVKDELDGAEIPWDVKADDEKKIGDTLYVVKDVQNDGDKQTLTLEKTESTTDKMTPEDIAKLVDANYQPGEEEGTYTLTREDSYVDEDGNEHTVITFIKVNGDGLVTTTTTTVLKLQREKKKQEFDQSITEDHYEYPPTTTIEDGKGNTYKIDLSDLLKDKDVKPGNTYEVKRGDLTYTITVGEEDKGTQINYSKKDIVAILGDGYELIGDEIYYTGNGEHAKLTVDEVNALRKSLSIQVKVSNSKGSTSTGEEITGDKTKADADAKEAAIKDALIKAAKEEGLTITADQITLDGSGNWTYRSDDGKTTYTFTYTADKDTTDGGKIKVDKSTVTDDKHSQIDNAWENKVNGTAYVTGSTITDIKNDESYESGVGGLGIGSDFTVAPAGATSVKRENDDPNGRILSYVDADDKTHTFSYTTVSKDDLTPEELTALEAAAMRSGWTLDELVASLTKVDWEVWSKETSEKVEKPIENPETITAWAKGPWTKTTNGNKFDFTYEGGSASGLEFKGTDKDGNEIYSKKDKNGVETIITVKKSTLSPETIREKFDAKFGEGKYTLDPVNKTITYVGADGKTYIASYEDSMQTLDIETRSPKEIAGTGSTEDEARTDFLKKMEEAIAEARRNGEDLILEDGNKKLTITEKTTWEEVVYFVDHVINFKAMSDKDLVDYLNKQKADAVQNDKYYSGSKKDKNWYQTSDGTILKPEDTRTTGRGYYRRTEIKIDGKWISVDSNWRVIPQTEDDYIGHLDLATDSNLTLSEKDENDNFKKDDCVLIEKTLEWNRNAQDLVDGKGNTTVGLLDRITYDDENDKDPSTGHYEFPRASWDDGADNNDKNHAPIESVFYKVAGKVAYGKLGSAYEATATGLRWDWDRWEYVSYFTDDDYEAAKADADAALKAYKDAHPELAEELKNAKVVEIYKDQNQDGERFYQIYLYESNLTAYGYLSDNSNTCGNAHFNAKNDKDYVGGYDLTLGDLTQVSKEEIVAIGKNTINCSATFTRIKKSLDQVNESLNYTPNTVRDTIIHESEMLSKNKALSGTYNATYHKTKQYQTDTTPGIDGHGSGSYTSYDYTDYHETTAESGGLIATRKDGFLNIKYRTEKDAELTPVSKTETSVKHAEVKYDYTTIDTAHVLIPGETTVVVTPEDPDLPAPDDETPVVTPETPELPPVQDATPDAEPTTDVVITPATPELPPVQDAAPDVISALPKTGVNWTAAIGMALSGMALMAAGAFTSLFHKAKH